MSERKAHREFCAICGEVVRVGFHVPDKIWELTVHHSQRVDIICLRCFTRMADEREVRWDKEITFYPTSRISHDLNKPYWKDGIVWERSITQ